MAALVLLPGVSNAQSVTVVDLPSATAKSAATFASVLNVVELSDGQLAVNDAMSRQLVYLDRALTTRRVILDSAMSTASYGNGSRAIIMCSCAEVWFPDVVSRSILTFDQSGAQKHVMAAPYAPDFILMMNARTIGDTTNHLFYRGWAPRAPTPGFPPPPGTILGNPDSAPLLRANFETRKVDTIASLRALRSWTMVYGRTGADGKPPAPHIVLDILGSIDEWTALPDGTVAIVRGYDYHIDWLLPNGNVVASPKLPFDFKRLTDADKGALMDSARKAELDKHRADYDKRLAAGPTQTYQVVRAASSSGAGSMEPPPAPMTVKIGPYVQPVVDDVSFDRMPDYYPPIRAGAMTSDLESNVWILPTTSAQSRAGELVYDVVSRERGLIMRVRLPGGRSIAGFGKNGTVYLMSRDADGKWFVERTSLPRKM
ncbi:MAG: hypothetical protein ABJB74_00940 [Gemmatimonas sp.]